MILVTGATGLVGSHLLSKLTKSGIPVRALYRSSIPQTSWSHKVQWVKGDILDIQSLEDAMDQVQQVYHCAAIVSFSPSQRQHMHQVNREGTANVVNAALEKQIGKLVFVSSVAALGRIRKDEMVHEGMQWTPETSNSEYGKSKFLSEMEVWRGIGEGLNAAIVNPVIILGAGNWEQGSSGIFKSAYDEFPWYTEGVSGFVDVEDVTEAMVRIMNSDIRAERFIISGGNHTYREVFTTIANAFGKKHPHKKVTPLLAAIVWRLEAIKSLFTRKNPLLTKETAHTAQAKVFFNNEKLLQALPGFKYHSLQESVQRITQELKSRYQL